MLPNSTFNSYVNAGLFRRAVAYFIDKVLGLLLILLILLSYAYFAKSEDGLEFLQVASNILTILLSFILLGTLLNTIYNVFFLSKFGGTLGKLLLGMQVFDVNTDTYITPKTAFYRTFAGYSFVGQFMGLGLLSISKKRNYVGWHDEMFNTEVRITGSVWPGVILTLLFLTLIVFVVLPSLFALTLPILSGL